MADVDKELEQELEDFFKPDEVSSEETTAEETTEETTEEATVEDTTTKEETTTEETAEEIKEEVKEEVKEEETTTEEETKTKEEVSDKKEETTKETTTEETTTEEEISLEEQNEKLRQVLEDITGEKYDVDLPEQPGGKKKEETTEEETATESEVFDPLKDVDTDELYRDPAVLKGVLERAMGHSRDETAKVILKGLPGVLGQAITQQLAVRDTATNYFNDNPDLLEVRGFFGKVVNKVHSANPKMKHAEVLEEAAKTTREALGLKKLVVRKKDDPSSPTKVALVKTKSSTARAKKTPDKRTEEQKDIDDLMEPI